MTFAVAFDGIETGNLDEEPLERRGYLLLGDYRESFIASLELWSTADYEMHWKNALSHILDGASHSCLITSLYDPKKANFIVWWPMYRYKESVLFHNQLLFLDELEEEFDPGDPYRFVPEYMAVNEDGDRISEWSLSVDEVRMFLDSL